MRSRTIAIVGSIAALSFAATPIAAVAATTPPHRCFGCAHRPLTRQPRCATRRQNPR